MESEEKKGRGPKGDTSHDTRTAMLARERAEKESLDARERVTNILETITDGFYALDQDWRFTYLNRAGEEMFRPLGKNRLGLLGKSVWTEFPEAAGTEIEAVYRRAFREQVTATFETFYPPLGKWFEIRAYPSPQGLSVYFRDITDRKDSEDIRRRLSAVVESSDDSIITMNLDTTITTWNKGAELMFGYTSREAIGKSVTMLIPANAENEEPMILNRLLRGERVEHYETVRQRKDESLLNVSLTVSPILDSAGKIVGVSKISRDITERKKHEAELRAAQAELRQHAGRLEQEVAERTARLRETIQELEAFSYTVSHDMRSPLRAMQGYADALLEDYKEQLDAEGQDYLTRIRRAASRMDLLIQDVLAYSRVAKGEITLREINLETVIADVIQHYPQLQQGEAAITVAAPLPTVVGHEAYLTQIVSNFLGNAVKFVPPGVRPQVRVSGEVRGEMVRVAFKDNGIGISAEHQNQIFQIFGRVYSEKKFEGTGIGLAIAKKAAERMGGSVGVVSQLGQGSEFFVLLRKAK